jgi:putative transposase
MRVSGGAERRPELRAMKRTRHSPEQIVSKLNQAATGLAGGKSIEEVCKGLGISPATYHRWQQQYGGADVNTVKELKALKEENAKLKKLVADLSLDKVALKELLEGKW